MSEPSPAMQLEFLKHDVAENAGEIFHAIIAVIVAAENNGETIEDDECMENDIKEAKRLAEVMKSKMRELIRLLDYIREASGDEE